MTIEGQLVQSPDDPPHLPVLGWVLRVEHTPVTPGRASREEVYVFWLVNDGNAQSDN